ncbi:Arc family DNA-binding protein [Rhizobium ruizarguesonis]|uniref:Arc family DNA-binding protein n=1 Tax=Rhizobium ruizarguesonis TaxID=2081791 RepID=UPI0013B6EBB9|nr:Arc family DNA-binding protein [Rhizobium ruizarguesonis]NEJ57493.1 Arc family DNA-binding protein [Rhizobium ruizarguesonis]NEJ64910.1 Arc family DNA-binding protein [Rhizobium ruizarguesonis]
MTDGADEVRLTLRLPTKLRDQITRDAAESGRSLNAEIVKRLETPEGESAKLAELKKQLLDEHQAYVRMEALFDSQMTVIEEYRSIMRGLTQQTLRDLGTIESLSSILTSLETPPTPEVVDMAKRLLAQALETKKGIADELESQRKKYGAD